MLKLVRLLLLCAGVAGAGYVLYPHLGTVYASLTGVGWGVLLYMCASFVVYALDCWGWRLAFTPGQPEVGFWRLFSARMSGEAVNKITPLASLGGEPLKAYLLARWGAGREEALASVLVAKNTMTLAQIAFVLLGVALAMYLSPGNQGLFPGFAVFPGLVLAAILVVAVLDHHLRRRRAGAGPPRKMNALVTVWSQVADFYRSYPRAFGLSIVVFFLGWAAGAVELLTAAALLGFPLSVADALALEALLVSVNMATFFVPANAGTQEGGFALLAPLFGIAQPHGVAMAVLRRVRDVLWVAFGLVFLMVVEGRVLFTPALDGGTSEA